MVAAVSIRHCVSAIKIPLGKSRMSEIAEPRRCACIDGCNHARSNARCCRKSQPVVKVVISSHPLDAAVSIGRKVSIVWASLKKKWDSGQPSLSQLGILRKDGLVNTRREGKQIHYSVASEDALAILNVNCMIALSDKIIKSKAETSPPIYWTLIYWNNHYR